MRLCFATNNAHKLEEVRSILGSRFQVVSLSDIGCHDELAEDQDTLEGNSRQKATYVFSTYGISCFADDTGLEVAALGGAPGVYSARFAGDQRNSEENITLLLHKLEDIEDRKAQFRTIITLLQPGLSRQFEGIVTGSIITKRKGKGGFGYDPVFVPDGHSKTLAEMSLEEKNQISHRARAMDKLVAFLKNS